MSGEMGSFANWLKTRLLTAKPMVWKMLRPFSAYGAPTPVVPPPQPIHYIINTHRDSEPPAGNHNEHTMTATLDHSDTPAIDTQEPTPDGLKEVITGLPLVRIPNPITDETCKRCARKNNIRRRHDLPQRDPSFSDGERATLICGYDADPDTTSGWEIRAAYHADHPTRDKDDVATPGQAVAEVTARLDRDGWTYTYAPRADADEPQEHHVEDRSVVRDVEIIWFSAVDDGQHREPIVELDDDGIATPKPTDPIPEWPEKENEWRREIIDELGHR